MLQMLTLDEVRDVLADVRFDPVCGESRFVNDISDTVRTFRDRIALGGEYTPEELARVQADGKKNAQFIIEYRNPAGKRGVR